MNYHQINFYLNCDCDITLKKNILTQQLDINIYCMDNWDFHKILLYIKKEKKREAFLIT